MRGIRPCFLIASRAGDLSEPRDMRPIEQVIHRNSAQRSTNAKRKRAGAFAPARGEFWSAWCGPGLRDYGLAIVTTGDDQTSQCAGFEASPRALSTDIFMT